VQSGQGDKSTTEWGYPQVEAQVKHPLKDATAVKATRFKLVETLPVFGLPIGTWTGKRTRWNRAQFGIKKTHGRDTLCIGRLMAVPVGSLNDPGR
jgi:hypothetical protein